MRRSRPSSIVVRPSAVTASSPSSPTGAITEGGSDTPADIVANAMVFSAATGVGTAGNAIETQTSFIEAETNTGGINIANYGPLQIGNISSNVEGLDVVTSGDINVSTTGFFLFNDTTGAEVVHGGDISGNVTLTAIGADSDMFATVDCRVVSAAGGGVTLNAGAISPSAPAGPTSTTTYSPPATSTSMPAGTSSSTAPPTSRPARSAVFSAATSPSTRGATSASPIPAAGFRRSRRSSATSSSPPARAAPIPRMPR